LVKRQALATRGGVRAKPRPDRRRPEQLGDVDGLLFVRAREAGRRDHELSNPEFSHRSWD